MSRHKNVRRLDLDDELYDYEGRGGDDADYDEDTGGPGLSFPLSGSVC